MLGLYYCATGVRWVGKCRISVLYSLPGTKVISQPRNAEKKIRGFGEIRTHHSNPHCTGGKRSALTSLKCVVCWDRLQQHSFSPQALRWGNKEMFDAAAELIPSHSLPQPHGDPGTCSDVCWRKSGLNLFI